MTEVVHQTFHGLPYNTRVVRGTTGPSDVGFVGVIDAYPQPGRNFSTIDVRWSGHGFDPYLACNPFLGAPNIVGWGLNEDQWEFVTKPNYSMAFEEKVSDAYVSLANKRIFECRDGTALKWGLQILPKQGLFDPDYLANLLTICDHNGNTVAGGTFPIAPNVTYKYEIQCKATLPYVTVRVYSFVASAWVLSQTLTASPGNGAAADRFQFGSFADQCSNYPNGTYGHSLSNVRAWDTSNADGAPAGSWGQPWPDTKFFVIENGVEVPIDEPKRIISGVETSVHLEWNRPYTTRHKVEIVQEIVTDPGNVHYSTDENCRYLIYRPPGEPPPGGWPGFVWPTTNYYFSGDYLGVVQDHFPMLQALINAGFAVISVGVRLAKLSGSGARFPDPILDAKLAARSIALTDNDINGDLLIIGGHSSGGGIGHAAMASRELTNNGFDVNMTLRGNGFGDIDDPAFIGCMVWSAPVDFKKSYLKDPTHPYWGNLQIVGTSVGDIRAAVNLYAGYAETATNPNLDGLNPAEWITSPTHPAQHVMPTLYFTSTGDTIVPSWNESALRAAYEAKGIRYEHHSIGHVPHPLMTSLTWANTASEFCRSLIP